MTFQNKEKRILKEKKARYRRQLLTGSGQWVLGDFLAGPCRFFEPSLDQETATRKTVGMELLCMLDLWVGPEQKTSPQRFVSKLARMAPEAQIGRNRPKEGDKKDG